MLACGMDPNGVMAELTGRRGGYSKGKGGSMHMFSREKNFFGGHGIVGAQVSIGTGLGFSHKYIRRRRRLRDLYGRRRGQPGPGGGELQHGVPVEVAGRLCDREQPVRAWAPRSRRASANTELAARGQSFGIPGLQVNGMDVLAVHQAGAEALRHARDGEDRTSWR